MCWRRLRLILAAVFAAGLAAAIARETLSDAADPQPAPFKSQIVAFDAAKVHKADWGEMRRYFAGESFGAKDVLTAVAIVEPGKAVHKAHRHAMEEYLAIVQGSGVWSLAGRETPAKRGDILYAEPWVFHGITNTGVEPLIFVVVRYTAKGVVVPPRPDDRPDELK
jgi:mannose-6-phosphate isomerase-like protein (cupin superfamily)